MAWLIRLTFGCLVALATHVEDASAQDFLKQLENRLKEAAGKKTEPPPAEAEKGDEGKGEAAEELPFPEATPAVKEPAPTMQLPPANKQRVAPLVITPKKKSPPPSPATPFVEPEPDMEEGGYLGLTVEPVPGGAFGLAVVEVMPQSPAWKSGFRQGDRVIGVGGQAVTSIDQFASELTKFAPGEPIKFLVQRRGRSMNLTAVLQDRAIARQLQGPLPDDSGDDALASPTPYQPISGQLIQDGGLVLGVSLSDLSEAFRQQFGIPVFRGASISEVVVGSAAERAGLRPGDCIVDIDGRMINFADDVVAATRSSVAGQSLLIGFYRGRQKMRVEVPVLANADPVARPSNRENWDRNANGPADVTSETIAEIQSEISRLQTELDALRSRVQDLENRLQNERRP
jgi:predicted metalloprotease with PDZ domain